MAAPVISTSPPELRIYLDAVRRRRGGHAYVSLLGLKTFDTIALHRKIKQGLSYAAFERFRRTLDLPAATVAETLQIAPRTLQRRKEQGRLLSDESDRLVRLAKIFGEALQLFEGDLDATRHWLNSPRPALGGARPIELAQTEPGMNEIETLIGRLEHGVFS